MKRIRLVFIVLAAVLLVPLGLLMRRALDSVEAERNLRHQVVAERVFDEMERELTMFLRREEDRPFEHYRYFYVPESGAETIELTRSALADPPEEEFIVGYFQVDPDGTVTCPRKPQNEALAKAIDAWSPSPEVDANVERVVTLVRGQWGKEGRSGQQVAVPKQNPGTTVALSQGQGDRYDAARESLEYGKSDGRDYSSRSALSELNRGAEMRQQRATKIAQKQAPSVYNFSRDEADNVLQREIYATQALEAEQDSKGGRRAVAPTQEVESAIEQAFQKKVNEAVNVQLEPMVGRLADSTHLLVYRTVLIEQKAYRQGLLLEIPALVAWLSDRVLVDSELASHARITRMGEEPENFPTHGGEYLFRHQFAEPFAHVAGLMSLDPLPESGGSTYVYLLSALLALVATLGLYSLYRMVAVAVAFAQRRYNFVSAVSHELKTPLTAIRMYGEMLRDGVVASNEKRQHYYGVITAETERLSRLVDNVLELSRLERKDRSLTVVVGNIGPVLEEVLGILDPHARKAGFSLRIELEENLPQVRYDRDALVQVLFNLVDNAIKYSRHAENKEIVLSCRRGEGGVVVAVTDRGPGVAPRHLRQVFEPFYRGESELTRTSAGTGIGLALVRGLVERMGGSVNGRNAERGGFVVSISLRSAAV